MFRNNFPKQVYDFGIAEQSVVAAAAGLALSGKIPFVYTAAPFLVYRAYEFIRDDVCLQNVPVKMAGSGSGISVSSLGPTHHSTEDVALLRCLPNLKILSPATPRQAFLCVKEAYKHTGPVYIRLGMNREKEYFGDDYSLTSGSEIMTQSDGIMTQGTDVVILSTGGILEEVMNAAAALKNEGVGATVINVVSIKPFEFEGIEDIIVRSRLICTVEEHNVIGGLGSIVAEHMMDKGIVRPFLKLGLEDRFTKGYGKLHQVRIENGLDDNTIAQRILQRIKEI